MKAPERSRDDTYGPWPWVVGIALGFGIIWVMFALATGFT